MDAGWDDDEPVGSSLVRRIGIVLGGTVVALAVIGQLLVLSHALGSSGTARPVLTSGPLTTRLQSVIGAALGGSDRGVARFRLLRIQRRVGRLDITVRWAINNSLASGTVGNGAQADVYVLLRDLYTSGLPLGDTTLLGTYPRPAGGGADRETVVMRLGMPLHTAQTIGRTGWDNFDPSTLWPLVRRTYIDSQLQPQPPE